MSVRSPVHVIPNVEVPMRDGTVLRADMYRPAEDGKYPVLLSRTPYDKSMANGQGNPAVRLASAGYVVLLQDCRGRFASDGDFYPFLHEMDDGYDSVEWAAAQPWSTGKVGMFGPSYVGATQWLAAASQPPHLVTIVPAVTDCNYHDGWFYQSGAFCLGFVLAWTLNNLGLTGITRLDLPAERKVELMHRVMRDVDDAANVMRRLPLNDFPDFLETGLAGYYGDWLANPSDGEYWSRWNVARFHERITVPVLAIGGWYDLFTKGTLLNFTGMRSNGGSELARKHQRLIMGPWSHTTPLFGPAQGDHAFGIHSLGAVQDLDGQTLRWFDHWMKGVDNGVAEDPPLTVFTIGAGEWQPASDWPLPGTRFTSYYFHSGGSANSDGGDGTLSPEAPGDEPSDSYAYDPRDPVPTRGGGTMPGGGAYDQRPVEGRHDVLVYSTPPLTQDVEVTGPISVKLFASSTAVDTDFTAKLVDVSPDGYALNLADNIVRARYRDSLERPELMEPGREYGFTIDLLGTSNLFRTGHRIRLEVSSSNFPRFDRNANTGGDPATETRLVPALQTVYHDSGRPSHVVLPIIPR